ncbi:aminopeptidase, partial [Deinococcus pimensis]|uniref:aminopeptidase n=1 Tax=Deinococcus pimensis TaxID=309888 RepID=UPI000488E088
MSETQTLSFEEKLDRYADLLVRIGVNVQPHQRLQLSAPLEAAQLARAVARKAYEAGCRLVEVAWSDDRLARIRYESAPRDSFEEFPDWRVRASMEAVERDDAFLTIYASDPDLLAGIDQELVATASRVSAERMRPVSEAISSFAINWSIGSMPIPSWARRVFPDLPEEEAMSRLWDAIFMATRADQPDPVAAWRTHLDALAARRTALNERAFSALHFRG